MPKPEKRMRKILKPGSAGLWFLVVTLPLQRYVHYQAELILEKTIPAHIRIIGRNIEIRKYDIKSFPL